MNRSLEFGQESVLLEIRNLSTETVVNSTDLTLFLWNLLEGQRLRFLEEVLTGAPHTQEQQQRPYDVHEYLEVPGIQDPIRGRKGHQVVVDNFSTSESAVATMSPTGTSGTDATPTSTNISNRAVNRHGFGYLLFEKWNGDEADVDVGKK